MKIYTKKGDQGKTSLLDGTRLEKSADTIEAYGSIDELNSWIGLIDSEWEGKDDNDISNTLLRIQNTLFVIGSILSANGHNALTSKLPQLTLENIQELEKSIDKMESKIPPLTSFILPRGNVAISHIHIIRTVCRRAERRSIKLTYLQESNSLIIPYLNRLSDFLFVLARYKSHLCQIEETIWQPSAS